MTVKIGIAAAAIGPLLIALSKVIKAVSVITKVLGLIASAYWADNCGNRVSCRGSGVPI